jgi:hypothetical protein
MQLADLSFRRGVEVLIGGDFSFDVLVGVEW